MPRCVSPLSGPTLVLRKLVGQVQRDGGRFEYHDAIIGYRGYLAVRVRVGRIGCATAVAVARRDGVHGVGSLELLEQENEARREGLRAVKQSDGSTSTVRGQPRSW